MDNIPTAEEFRLNTFTGLKESQEVKHLYDDEDINDIMIKFAVMHVTAALKAAQYNADTMCKKSMGKSDNWVCKECMGGGCENSIIDKHSILTGYPLTNIK